MFLWTRKNFSRIVVALLMTSVTFHLPAETTQFGMIFQRDGADYRGFFSETTTGTVTLFAAPGLSATTQTLRLQDMPLGDCNSVTTDSVYNPATTNTIVLQVKDACAGPHYLIARLPGIHAIRWTYYIRRESSYPAPKVRKPPLPGSPARSFPSLTPAPPRTKKNL